MKKTKQIMSYGERFHSDAASGKISRISKCFQRSNQDLKKYFSKQYRCNKNFKTIGDYTHSTDLIFKTLSL
jgi:hypothetical protein